MNGNYVLMPRELTAENGAKAAISTAKPDGKKNRFKRSTRIPNAR